MKLNLEKVKLLMASNCLSIRGLSEKSGINYITLIPYLNGSRNPKTEKLGKIRELVGMQEAIKQIER